MCWMTKNTHVNTHTYMHAFKEITSATHSLNISRVGALIKQFPGAPCYASVPKPTHTNAYIQSLFYSPTLSPSLSFSLTLFPSLLARHVCTLICRHGPYIPASSHEALSRLTSFIKWLSHLADVLRRSIIALYHHLYWWHFAWLCVFLIATLRKIESNDI